MARACERPPGREPARARDAATGAKRREPRGWGGVRRRAERCGAGLKGAAVRRAQAKRAPQGANEVSDRGARRACARRTAGALAVFAADPLAITDKRALGTLAVFAAGPLATMDRRTDRTPATIYKRTVTAAKTTTVPAAPSAIAFALSRTAFLRSAASAASF